MILTFQSTLLEKKSLTGNVYFFRFARPADPVWTFQAGQYLIFHIPSKDSHAVRRLYSIASPPQQKDSLDFIIELLPQGIGSDYLRQIAIGQAIAMQGPAGMFTLKPSPRPKVFLVTGTGIAPARSIFLSINATEGYLFWGLKTAADVYFFEELKNLKNCVFKLCLSRETDLAKKLKPPDLAFTTIGHVTQGLEEMINKKQKNYSEFDYYLCGGNRIVESLRLYLSQLRVPAPQVFFEKFN